MVDSKTITENTLEYIYTFDSEKYDDVLVVMKNLNAENRVNAQIRFKVGQYYSMVQGIPIAAAGQQNLNTVYGFKKILGDLYRVENNTTTTTTTTIAFVNQNFVGKKIDSVRINSNSGYFIQSAEIQIYGKVRSEFL